MNWEFLFSCFFFSTENLYFVILEWIIVNIEISLFCFVLSWSSRVAGCVGRCLTSFKSMWGRVCCSDSSWGFLCTRTAKDIFTVLLNLFWKYLAQFRRRSQSFWLHFSFAKLVLVALQMFRALDIFNRGQKPCCCFYFDFLLIHPFQKLEVNFDTIVLFW